MTIVDMKATGPSYPQKRLVLAGCLHVLEIHLEGGNPLLEEAQNVVRSLRTLGSLCWQWDDAILAWTPQT